jgi:hypothetical protein
MKNSPNVVLLCFLLLLGVLKAQNWAPINGQERFNYRLDTSNIITAVVFADSVTSLGGDSVYHLNRIVTTCDTCSSPQLILLSGQPQFLMRRAVAKAGGWWNFQDSANLALPTLAAQGYAWRFDSLQMIDASIDSVFLDSVFGQADSIKRILLTSGDTILLSQAHGILQWPASYGSGLYHNLVGIAGRNLGKLMPGFRDFFPYQPGDVLQFRHWDFQCNGGPLGCNGPEETLKITIDSVSIQGDSIRFFYHGIVSHINHYFGYGSSYAGPTSGSWVMIDSINHATRAYPNQVLSLYKFFRDYFWLPTYPIENMVPEMVAPIDYYDAGNGRLGLSPKFLYQSGGFCNQPSGSPFLQHCGLNQDTICMEEGLGLKYFQWTNFEATGYWYIQGYYNGTDTIGYIWPDNQIVGADEPNSGLPMVQVFPKPSQGEFFVRFGEEFPEGICDFELISASGQVVLGQALEARPGLRASVDATRLPTGIYAYRVLVAGQVLEMGKLAIHR